METGGGGLRTNPNASSKKRERGPVELKMCAKGGGPGVGGKKGGRICLTEKDTMKGGGGGKRRAKGS